MGDQRDYLTSIGAGWQQLVIELTFEPSAQATSSAMGFVVSHPNRTGAAHLRGIALPFGVRDGQARRRRGHQIELH